MAIIRSRRGLKGSRTPAPMLDVEGYRLKSDVDEELEERLENLGYL